MSFVIQAWTGGSRTGTVLLGMLQTATWLWSDFVILKSFGFINSMFQP